MAHPPATPPSDPTTLHAMTQAATEAQLRELDSAIDAAVSSPDAATLDRLLADDFVYTHAGVQRSCALQNQLRNIASRASLQPIPERNQTRADVPREERKWYG
jgi:hypothetical protein